MEGGREDGKEGGRGGGADTELKTKTPHVNAGKNTYTYGCNQSIPIYMDVTVCT